MARPTKTGLDYFPMDTDWDRKMKVFKAKYKLQGIGLITELFKAIYSEGYFYPWDDETRLLFADEHHIEEFLLSEMIVFAIGNGLFSKHLFDKYNILTSSGIQKRYLSGSFRRANVLFHKDFLLIEPEIPEWSKTKLVISSETPVKYSETPVIYSDGTHSKVKESKVKKRRYTPPAAETAEKSKSKSVKISENRYIYHLIENAFVNKNQDFNFKREGPHIKQLEEKALARASPEDFTKKIIVVFWELVHSDDKLFKKQPFLPSILNSGGLWPRVLKELENREEQLDPEIAEITRRIFNYDSK